MALVAVVIATAARRRTGNTLPWVVGALAVYVVVILADGGRLGPDLGAKF
jgi:hypothetical protein